MPRRTGASVGIILQGQANDATRKLLELVRAARKATRDLEEDEATRRRRAMMVVAGYGLQFASHIHKSRLADYGV